MKLYYKIVEAWPEDHLIVVRYWTDIITEEFLAQPDSTPMADGSPNRCRSDTTFTLPVPTPTGEELDKLISSGGPVEWLKLLESIHDPSIDTSLNDIKNMIGVVKEADISSTQQLNMTDADIEELISKIQNM
jgi:hypothetical protein